MVTSPFQIGLRLWRVVRNSGIRWVQSRHLIEYFPAKIRTRHTDQATLGLFASSVFSMFTLICLGLASALFARRTFSMPLS